MKLYTRTGDDGSTGLFGAGRVDKDHPRIEAYGTVDELTSWLGMCVAACDGARAGEARVAAMLTRLQSRLFDLGADLATPGDASAPAASRVARIEARHVEEAERFIDEIEAGNDPIRAFVLPGGSELAARLNVARTVCRRAERLAVSLSKEQPVGASTVHLLNRISDLLFAMARRANKERGVADVEWNKNA